MRRIVLVYGLVVLIFNGCLGPPRGYYVGNPKPGDSEATASFTPGQTEVFTRSVVHISAYDGLNRRIHRGSGVVVAVESIERYPQPTIWTSFILTAGHLLNERVAYFLVTVGNPEAPQRVFKALVYQKGESDWMLLTADGKVGVPCQTIPERTSFTPFGPCLAVGHPLGDLRVWVTEGLLQGNTDAGQMRFTSPIIFGNSGGALVGLLSGRAVLVGITVAVAVSGVGDPVAHMGYAVPLSVVRSEGGVW